MTDKVDVWAAGVIAFYLFSGGNYPFDGETQEELCHEIVNSEPDWDSLDESTSPLVKKFIQACLIKEPARRPSASLLLRQSDILKHAVTSLAPGKSKINIANAIINSQ